MWSVYRVGDDVGSVQIGLVLCTNRVGDDVGW